MDENELSLGELWGARDFARHAGQQISDAWPQPNGHVFLETSSSSI